MLRNAIRRLKPFALAVIVAVLLPIAAHATEQAAHTTRSTDPTIAAGRELSQLFADGKTQALWQRMTPPMQAALGSEEALAAFQRQIAAQLGSEGDVLSERSESVSGVRVYLRDARWSKAPVAVTTQWALDAAGAIAGFYIRPAQPAVPAASAYLDYRTHARLRLPFEGEWFVFWGGRTLEQNYHVSNRGQRFASDVMKVVDGATHRDDGKELADYYCWNEKILAPAAGRVVAAIDEWPDQAIGTTNAANPAGNHVILDLGNDEYALLAHLRRGSVQVKTGDKVAAGAELGRCGNSGNTSEPHLHFHLQNQARFGEGDGLPAFFHGYVADGKPVERGELVRGQRVWMP